MRNVQSSKEAEGIMTSYVDSMLHPAHGVKVKLTLEDVHLVLLQQDDVVNTKVIFGRVVPRTDPALKTLVNWDHPHARSGKHGILQMVLIWSAEGNRISRATAFIPL